MSITDAILEEFKDRMHLGDEEDENLKGILKASHDDLKRLGDYDIGKDTGFKELIFERSRYVYNDALEYFYQNFSTQINNLIIDHALEEIEGDEDASF